MARGINYSATFSGLFGGFGESLVSAASYLGQRQHGCFTSMIRSKKHCPTYPLLRSILDEEVVEWPRLPRWIHTASGIFILLAGT